MTLFCDFQLKLFLSSFCVNSYCASALALFKFLKSVYMFNTHHVIISRFYQLSVSSFYLIIFAVQEIILF